MSTKTIFLLSRREDSCRPVAVITALLVMSALSCTPRDGQPKELSSSRGIDSIGKLDTRETTAANATTPKHSDSNRRALGAVAERIAIGDNKSPATDGDPKTTNASETAALKLEARLVANDKEGHSPQIEVVFKNPLQSEVAIFLGDSIDALFIDVFEENGKRIPQRIVAGKRRPRSSDETGGAFSGRTAFVKPAETLKWTIDLSDYFDLPKGKSRVIAKTHAQVINHDEKIIDAEPQSQPVEFVIK